MDLMLREEAPGFMSFEIAIADVPFDGAWLASLVTPNGTIALLIGVTNRGRPDALAEPYAATRPINARVITPSELAAFLAEGLPAAQRISCTRTTSRLTRPRTLYEFGSPSPVCGALFKEEPHMKLSRFALPMLAPLAILACDDDGGGGSPLTCETLAPTGNCWRTAVAEAYACMPEDSPEDGTFSGDRTSCTYTEGQTLAFKTAVPLDPDFDYVWDVTISNGATQCARFLSNDSTTSVTTASGTTSFTTSGSSVTLTCADGSRFSTSNALALFQCEGDVDLPGIAWSGTDGPISFSLTAAPEGRFGFFNCE